MKKLFISVFYSLFLLLVTKTSPSQDVPTYQWKNYVSYQDVKYTCKANDKIFCASTTGLFSFDYADNNLEIYDKLTGLSDVNFNTLAYEKDNRVLMVVYTNSDIDIIQNNTVTNVPEIKNKSIVGDKSINSISFDKGLAYISCGFGIVVYDVSKGEVKDTYFIGPNGSNVKIFQTCIYKDSIFAASENTIYYASMKSDNLADFRNWKTQDIQNNYPGGITKNIVSVGNSLIAFINNKIYEFKDSQWVLANVYQDAVGVKQEDNNKLIVESSYGITVYNENLQQVNRYFFEDNAFDLTSSTVANNGDLWMGKSANGLYRFSNNSLEKIFPDGPANSNCRRIQFINDKLFVAPGIIRSNFVPGFDQSGFYVLESNKWNNVNKQTIAELTGVFDISNVVENPLTRKVYLASYGSGLVEFNAGNITIFNTNNSSLQGTVGAESSIRVNGLGVDSKGQVWVANWGAAKPISRLKRDGTWQSFSIPSSISTELNDMLVDQYDQIWVAVKGRGILVFKENKSGFLTYRFLSTGDGQGGLPSGFSDVLSLEEDLEGRIWVGTGKGVVVFYNPFDVFSGGAANDAQSIKVIQDGLVQLLLETENVNCIKVDGADRKWIGTDNGLWLFSKDGTQQINYFNIDNSPLFSNKINDIAINPNNGEVFIASDKGLISFKGDATQGKENNTNVQVFPNPVRPDFDGIIAIRGLVENSKVKITDITGNIVFETYAKGGQANWNGKDFKGNKANTGVYMVLVTNADGTETSVEKILFIN